MSRLIQVHFVSLQWCHSLSCNCNLIDDFKLSTQAIAPLLSFFFWYLAVRITTGHLIIDDQLLASSVSYLLLIRKMFSLLCLHIASHRHLPPRWRSTFVCLARSRQLSEENGEQWDWERHRGICQLKHFQQVSRVQQCLGGQEGTCHMGHNINTVPALEFTCTRPVKWDSSAWAVKVLTDSFSHDCSCK